MGVYSTNMREEYLNLEGISTCGLKMKVVGYRANNDIDVKFEDNTIVTGKTISNFKKGKIGHPDLSLTGCKSNFREGLTKRAPDGRMMKIIRYNTVKDIDIEFDDGEILSGVYYRVFLTGRYRGKNKDVVKKRLNSTAINNDGDIMRIIAYRSASDIDVEFEDNSIARGRTYKEFKQGRISNPSSKDNTKYIGLVKTSTCGMSMEIIAYRNSGDIDVKFEDGSIARSKAMSSFNSGKIAPPDRLQNKYHNMNVLANNGLYMRVKEYRSQKDIDVEFEDNTVVRNKAVNDFLKGHIGHPAIPKQLSQKKGTTGKIGDFTLLKVVNKSKSGVYYLCKCNKCDYEDIMTPQEMLSHKCC